MIMAKASAGLLMYRTVNGQIEVFLVHPGGPFWKNRDQGAWSIPKGEYTEDEDPLDAAQREFQEETGFAARGPYSPLEPIRLKSGKRVLAWAFAGDGDPGRVKSNSFRLEWPPKSGQWADFPEVDRAAWFSLSEARLKIHPEQISFLEQLKKSKGAE